MFEHVIQYDASLPFDELQAMYDSFEMQYGVGKFLFLPNGFTYSQFDLESMKQIRDNMNKIIAATEKLQKQNNKKNKR